MSVISAGVYDALLTLKKVCISNDCSSCPLSVVDRAGDLACIFQQYRPGNILIGERYFIDIRKMEEGDQDDDR